MSLLQDHPGDQRPAAPLLTVTRIIDAWAQHPTARHLNHPMFESLRRWTRGDAHGRGRDGRVAGVP